MFSGSVRPVVEIAAAAERLADGESGVRVSVRGTRAVRRLAARSTRWPSGSTARDDRQALLADVTHELRTPLQVIGGSVEAMIDGVHPLDDAHLAPILAEIAVMNRLLDDLRTVSLAEVGCVAAPPRGGRCPAGRGRRRRGSAAAATEAGVELTAVAGPPIVLDADPLRVREVLANLVVNGVRHTPAGGSVRWMPARTARSRADGDRHRRGHRPRRPRTGLRPLPSPRRHRRRGLGLTIVRDLAAAHGGTVDAESDGVAGRGATFRVPAPPAALGPASRDQAGARAEQPRAHTDDDQAGGDEQRGGVLSAGGR